MNKMNFLKTFRLHGRIRQHYSYKAIGKRQFSNLVVQKPIETDETCFLTDYAAKRLTKIKEKSGKKNLFLRLQVQGGGCKGFEYVFETTESPAETEDFVFETNGERVLIDETSFELVKGSQIDYTQDLIRESFEVSQNPNAEGACGCGVSFAAKMSF